MIRMWDAICVGFEPQPWLFNINKARPYPKFLKIPPPPAQKWNSVRLDQYAHPQQRKMLKCLVIKYVGRRIQGFGASAITLHHQSSSTIPQVS